MSRHDRAPSDYLLVYIDKACKLHAHMITNEPIVTVHHPVQIIITQAYHLRVAERQKKMHPRMRRLRTFCTS